MLTGKVEFGSPEKIDIGIIFLTFKLTLYYVVSVLMYIFHMNSFFFFNQLDCIFLNIKKKRKLGVLMWLSGNESNECL